MSIGVDRTSIVVTPVRDDRVMRVSPWEAIKDRDNLHVRIVELPPGVKGACQRVDGHEFILLSKDLDQEERAITLWHELIHLERDGGCPDDPGMPDSWRVVVLREERRVQREAEARRWTPEMIAAAIAEAEAQPGA
jgi:hypothetical protein